MKRLAIVLLAAVVLVTAGLAAQTKAPATFADYGKWETLAPAGARGGLSPDGKWLTYAINRSNRDNELAVTNLADGTKKVVPFGTAPGLLVGLGVSRLRHRAVRGRAGEAPGRPEAGAEQAGRAEARHGRDDDDRRRRVVRVQPGRHVPRHPAVRRRTGPAAGAPARCRAEGRAAARGAATRRRPTIGRARRSSSATWRPAARRRSATSRSSPGRTPSADTCWRWPSARPARPATACSSTTRRPACCACWIRRRRSTPGWPGAGTRPTWPSSARRPTTRRTGPRRRVLAWTDLGKTERLRTYDPAADKAFPAGMRTVSTRRLSWSDDGRTLFLGIAKWDDKAEPAGRGGAAGPAPTRRPPSKSGTPRTSS